MLTLNDGRSELWQWDTGRKLTVDADCSQVHFSNKIFGRSIDVVVVDGVAIIPDILLQTDKDLNVWAFVGTAENGYTKISKTFKVNRRNMPADYVFTPPDQTSLEEIKERLENLESIQDPDAIKNAVDDYLANNPIMVKETDPTVPEWAKQPTPPDVKIPDKLPNPHSITFTGAVDASYDGSNPVEIKIPYSGGNVENGEDGFSPVATVTQTDSGAVISITDKNGTTTATVVNGKDGVDGKDGYTPVKDVDYRDGIDGKDGYTPVKGKDYFDGRDGSDGMSATHSWNGTVLTITSASGTSSADLKGDKGNTGATGKDGVDGKDYTFDPTVYALPVLELTGDISPIKVSKDNKVTLDYVYGERSGTCTLKGQGATSYKMAKAFVDAGKAGKFNYTIKFDTAFEAFEGWGEQQKYCLKANWIDHTHCRNVVSAKLWGKVRKNRSGLDSNLSALPNAGAVDGFPIVIMLNGEYHGLYTFNIPKDGWMFGLVEDSTKTQAIVGANDHTTATQFKGECLVDESDFELEFVSDEDNADWVATSLNRLINACIDSWGGDLDTVIAQYVDLKSVVDYIIFTVLIDGRDCTDKNYILTTFDGTKWFFSAYDLDSTYGLRWDASKLHRPDETIGDAVTLDKLRSVHRLFELIIRFKTDELKSRYAALRKSVLSEYSLAEMFENFAWAIPSPVLEEDVKLYPTILGSSVNSVEQILRWLHQRLAIVDTWIESLPAQETPTIPEPEGITNRVLTAIDTDGSVFNGTGYKDGVRLSGNPPAESSKSGMVITGYIPVTAGDVIRMAGTTWGTSPASTYLFLYDADFKCLGSYNGGGYVGYVNYLPDTTKDETVFQDKSLQSVTTDNGVATFNLKFYTEDYDNTTGSGMIASSHIAYMRISAIGNGADMIVTLNEEIT